MAGRRGSITAALPPVHNYLELNRLVAAAAVDLLGGAPGGMAGAALARSRGGLQILNFGSSGCR
jgi:hypothetical protein